MYILLDTCAETFTKFDNLEDLRLDLEEMAENDTYAFSLVQVYEIFDPVQFDVVPIRVIFPEKE